MSHIKGNSEQQKAKIYQTKTVSDKNIPSGKNDLTHILHLNKLIEQSSPKDLLLFIEKETPSQYAIKTVVNELIKKYDTKNENFYKILDILLQAGGGNPNYMLNFVDNEHPKNLEKDDEITLLMFAVIMQDIEMVKIVLKYDKEVNTQNQSGKTALVYDILYNKNDDISILNLLIEHNANVNQVFKLEINPNKFEYYSVFTLACHKDLPKHLKVLIDNHVDVNYQTSITLDTGLHICAKEGRENCLKVLLNCDRIHPKLINKEEKTAHEIIPDNENKKEINDNLTTDTLKSNNHKRNGGGKKKKEKMQVVAKDKSEKAINYEKKVLELIHDKNPAKEDYDIIYDIISKHFFLQTLTHQAKEEIIVSMSLYKVAKGVTLYTQGLPGNYWYIVQSGELSVFMNDKPVDKLKKGQSFGERALMDGTLRSNTIVADTECRLWALKRQVFRKIIEFIFTSNYEENMKFLDQVDLPIESTLKSIMANNLIQEIYLKGQYICREGEFGNSLYIIKDGEVECLKGETCIRILKKGDNFGQKALLEGDRRSLDVRAKTDCKIYSISSEFFKNQYGDNFKQVSPISISI